MLFDADRNPRRNLIQRLAPLILATPFVAALFLGIDGTPTFREPTVLPPSYRVARNAWFARIEASQSELRSRLAKQPYRPRRKAATDRILRVSFRDNGEVLGLSDNGSVVVWRLSDDRLQQFYSPAKLSLHKATFLPVSNQVARLFGNEPTSLTLELQRLDTGATETGPELTEGIFLSALTAAGNSEVLAYASENGVQLCRLDGHQVISLDTGPLSFGACAVDPSGRHLAIGMYNPRILHIPSGALRMTVATNGLAVGGLRFNSSGTLLVMAGFEGYEGDRVLIWDLDERRIVFDRFGPGFSVDAVAISRSDKLLATVSMSSVVSIWQISSRRLIAQWLCESKIIGGVEFSPNEKLLAVGFDDGIRVYDVPVPANQAEGDRPSRMAMRTAPE